MRIIRETIERIKERRRKEFAAKLKYGKRWHYKLYPYKYTRSTGPK